MREGLSTRIADALAAICHPRPLLASSVDGVDAALVVAVPASRVDAATLDVDALVLRLFREEGASLVRLVRLFVDDRNAAEDLVQEAFIRLARHAHRLRDERKAAAYLRTIALNLARDENRRGLVSLRHHVPADDTASTAEDEVVLRDDQQQVIDALRELPLRQRDCIVLRHYYELGIAEIAENLAISENSVKTHLRRGMASLERLLEQTPEAQP
jgi:RNA polymerase sigma factor (sigma-70 family)